MKSMCTIAILSFCMAVAMAQTQCEKHRERELKSNALVKLIPKCDENGDYEAFQCFEDTTFCTCWRPDGSTIKGLSKYIKTCACHVHRDRELKNSETGMVGNFVPDCEESGYYSRKQCHGSTGFCWCADQDGNQVSEEVRGKIDC